MFGDREAACADEVMFALVLLKDKASTWFEYVLNQTKSIECKTGEAISFTQTENVFYNMDLRKTVRPEVMIGSDIYTDGNLERNNYHMVAALVHETCHIDQMHDSRWLDMSRNASEKECHIAALDALKKIGAPQYMIDQEQSHIDRYS
jgi:hypothetical protein